MKKSEMGLLPTPRSLSPLTQKGSSASRDSWQSRLSSPVCSLTRDVPQALTELHSLPVRDDGNYFCNPHLQLLLEIESRSFVDGRCWRKNNKSLDVNQDVYRKIRMMLLPFADDPNETAFIATMMLRQMASCKRIYNGSPFSAYIIAAAFLAGKVCEECDPKLEELISESDYAGTVCEREVLAAERRMACELDWNFAYASPTELGFSLLDCLEGLKPSVKAALMQIVTPVCYLSVCTHTMEDTKPSVLVAAIVTALFTLLFQKEAQRSKWASLFSQLVAAPCRTVYDLSCMFNSAVSDQMRKILKPNCCL